VKLEVGWWGSVENEKYVPLPPPVITTTSPFALKRVAGLRAAWTSILIFVDAVRVVGEVVRRGFGS
jgi:hypothetical protein